MNSNKRIEPDCSTSSDQRKSNPKKPPRMQKEIAKRKADSTKKQSMNLSREERQISEKLSCIQHPLIDLPPIKYSQKFLGRYRLFVGNLPSDTKAEEFVDLFKKFGEVSDVFLQPGRGFGFIRLDYLHNTIRAKETLANSNFKNRKISVKISPFASVLVQNLPVYASNELLHAAFSIFGDIEYCTIVVDSKGKSLQKGIVDFMRKNSAILAKKYCSEQPFLIANSLKPVIVKNYEILEDTDCGLSEENFGYRNKPAEYYNEREGFPRFANNRFEYEYSNQFKSLYETYELQKAKLEQEFKEAEKQLEANAMKAQYDHETERLKEILRQREMEIKRWMDVKNNGQLNQMPGCSHNDVSKILFQGANELNRLLDTQEQKLEQERRYNLNNSNSSMSYECNSTDQSDGTNANMRNNNLRKRQRLY